MFPYLYFSKDGMNIGWKKNVNKIYFSRPSTEHTYKYVRCLEQESSPFDKIKINGHKAANRLR